MASYLKGRHEFGISHVFFVTLGQQLVFILKFFMLFFSLSLYSFVNKGNRKQGTKLGMVNAASFHIQFKNINVDVQMNLNVGQKDCDNLALKWDLVLSIIALSYGNNLSNPLQHFQLYF